MMDERNALVREKELKGKAKNSADVSGDRSLVLEAVVSQLSDLSKQVTELRDHITTAKDGGGKAARVVHAKKGKKEKNDQPAPPRAVVGQTMVLTGPEDDPLTAKEQATELCKDKVEITGTREPVTHESGSGKWFSAGAVHYQQVGRCVFVTVADDKVYRTLLAHYKAQEGFELLRVRPWKDMSAKEYAAVREKRAAKKEAKSQDAGSK
jgi:hypothetical protein